MWQEHFASWDQWEQLQVQNQNLLADNVKLRGELLRLENGTVEVTGGEVIHGTTNKSSNLFVLKISDASQVTVGQGVLAQGQAAGRIAEVAGSYALMLPLIHTEMQWSARLGRNGEMGRVMWSGQRLSLGEMVDLPRSARAQKGDTVFTSGYDGVFPADVPIGYVTDTESIGTDEFQSAQIEWAVDFHRIRHVELVHFPNHALVDSLHQLIDTSVQ